MAKGSGSGVQLMLLWKLLLSSHATNSSRWGCQIQSVGMVPEATINNFTDFTSLSNLEKQWKTLQAFQHGICHWILMDIYGYLVGYLDPMELPCIFQRSQLSPAVRPVYYSRQHLSNIPVTYKVPSRAAAQLRSWMLQGDDQLDSTCTHRLKVTWLSPGMSRVLKLMTIFMTITDQLRFTKHQCVTCC